MATISAPAPTFPSRRRGWRIALYLLLLIVLLAGLGLAAWIYATVRSALPQLDGTVSVSGLSAPVTVTRDSHGVPTIDAANLNDLFFAQGYVTAQDRLWQMDSMRRYASGELAEISGDDMLEHDREQRILGMRQAARTTVTVTPAEDRARFEAYARGVNAYIESHRDRLPLEFHILRYTPKPWTTEDSALIAVQMVKDLNHYQYRRALTREKVLAKLGPELTADLYVNTSWHDRPPTAAGRGFKPDVEEEDRHSSSMSHVSPETFGVPFEQLDPVPLAGSNNWVVSGAHTVTGKPLLSNDMHLGHQMPNLWYEAHLRSGNFDVAGVTLPGFPYVIVGHNQRIAWGFTNVGPTVEDVYIENFNANGQYQTPQGWKDAEHRHEVIHVKGKPDVDVDVQVTRHGPIVTSLVPGETRPLALRWTMYDGARVVFFDVDSAQNWDDFRRAFSRFDAPGQNVVYADVDGNIGYQATGKIPIRASGDGSLPENGSDDAHEWTSYIPYEKMPSVLNPESGIIGTANGRITPDDYPWSISTSWEAPWRTARIYRVLESGKKFSSADMLGLQTDIYSEAERYFAERFVYSVDHAKSASVRAKQAAEIMRAWDGRMTADSAAPTICYAARQQLVQLLLEPKLEPAPDNPTEARSGLNWKSYSWGLQSVWLENVLQHQPKRWLPDAYANYDEILAAAVALAVAGPDAPPDLSKWQWGAAHPVEIQHPIFGRIPYLQRWSGPGVQPQSGSGYTVKAVTRDHGPSERFTADLSNWDQTNLNLVTGQGGNLMSPYYMDQWDAWYEGHTFALAFSKDAVARSRAHELMLAPK